MSENLERRQSSKCEKSFTNSSMHNTNRRHPRYACTICSKSYASKASLRVHVKFIHSKTENRFQCPTCPYGTMAKTSLHAHIRTHTGEMPFKCVECPKTFATKGTLSNHHRSRHIPDPLSRTEECKFCGKCFKFERQMQHHVRRMHDGEKSFACSFDGCTMMFYANTELTQHTQQRHSDEKPFRCAICLKAFKLKTVYDRHHSMVHVSHSGLRPFECKKCDSTFNTKGALDKHIRSKHMPENVTRTEECPLCGKCFKTPNALRVHNERMHLRRKPWTCPEGDCDSTFCSKIEVTTHKRNVHSDVRRFRCAVCLAAFKQRGDFSRHYGTVHAKGK